MSSRARIKLALTAPILAFAWPVPVLSGDTLELQRAAFIEAYPAAELGDREPARKHESLLRQYVLWPDLEAAWLRANLHDDGAIRRFLDQHSDLKPARDLRYRYALHLARSERFPEYLEIYRRWYKDLGIARLDCLALQARILAGNNEEIAARGRELWLVGQSQVDECDPVFDYLRAEGLLGDELYRQRFEIAVDKRQFSLARYLARSLEPALLDEANEWISAQNSPDDFLMASGTGGGDLYREQLVYALEQLAYRDAELAAEHWRRIRDQQEFPPLRQAGVSRHIALWLARQHRPSAFTALRALPAEGSDVEVQRWLVRSSLLRHSWEDAITVIEGMPEEERSTEEWQYWLAAALKETGKVDEAMELFAELADTRSYYAFLAADELGLEYSWAHAALPENKDALERLATHASLVRARELFYVGLESGGRSEWDGTVAMLPAEEKPQAALLAHRWGWHSRAIATLASVEQYDDLDVRYPLPYREHFEKHAEFAAIPHSWAYGVARSESLFMADIRSIAGAVGVMQLMPETGRRTASEMQLPYAGLASLTDPDSNIRLGTFYLGKMLQRFGDNHVLATAAYNAGPLRVDQWLPEKRQLDARIWIENIPYNETRGYVRRVLVTDAIFHWRLTGETRRLSERLVAIEPVPAPGQLAQASREKRRDDS